jgi:hypothetical protein
MLGLFRKPELLNGIYQGITYNISNAERTLWKDIELTFIFNEGECKINGKGIQSHRHTTYPVKLTASFNVENPLEYRLSVRSKKYICVYDFEIVYENNISIRLIGVNSKGLLEMCKSIE